MTNTLTEELSILDKYKVDYPSGINKLSVPSEVLEAYGLDELPQGVGIIGGAARSIALRLLTGEYMPVRDVDLTFFEGCGPELSYEEADELSREYMPDDYEYGYGVGTESLDDYFDTRDFTVNEVAVINGEVLMTEEAKLALINKIIKPSCDEGDFNEKLSIKALLFQAVFQEEYGAGSIKGELDSRISPFFIALGLNKAFQYPGGVVERFTKSLYSTNNAPKWAMEFPVDFARNLLDEVYSFEFRGSELADEVHYPGGYKWYDDFLSDVPLSSEMENGVDLAYRSLGERAMREHGY